MLMLLHGTVKIAEVKLILLVQKPQMILVFMICQAMYGNGAKMFMMKKLMRNMSVIIP